MANRSAPGGRSDARPRRRGRHRGVSHAPHQDRQVDAGEDGQGDEQRRFHQGRFTPPGAAGQVWDVVLIAFVSRLRPGRTRSMTELGILVGLPGAARTFFRAPPGPTQVHVSKDVMGHPRDSGRRRSSRSPGRCAGDRVGGRRQHKAARGPIAPADRARARWARASSPRACRLHQGSAARKPHARGAAGRVPDVAVFATANARAADSGRGVRRRLHRSRRRRRLRDRALGLTGRTGVDAIESIE